MKIEYVVVGLMLVSIEAFSQSLVPVVEKDSTSNAWVQLASGAAFYEGGDEAASYFLSFSKRWDQNLLIVRLAGFSEFLAGYTDVGLMYGYLITEPQEKLHASVSIGLSHLTGHGSNLGLFGGSSGSYTFFRGLGIPYQANINWKLSKYWSVGATWLGNVNESALLNGISFGFQIGDLK